MNDHAALRFEIEWETADGVRAPELAATWARLAIWIGTECITEVENIDAGTMRRSVYGSLYPLAEWVAYNWWFLRGHSRPAGFFPDSDLAPRLETGKTQQEWLHHHNVREAGDGFAWPNLIIVPEGRVTRLVWRADRVSEPFGVRFIREGSRVVREADVARALREFVVEVVTRLAERRVGGTILENEWEALERIEPDEAEFCLACARLGLDPLDEGQDLFEPLSSASQSMSPQLFEEFADAVDPAQLGAGLDWVRTSSRRISRHANGAQLPFKATPKMLAIARGDGRPWEIGWQQARALRKQLGLDASDSFDPDKVVDARTVANTDLGLQALGGLSETGSAVLVLGRPVEATARRFAKARALWHFAFDVPRDRFLLTRTYTSDRKTERAFAAELLAPAAAVRGAIAPQGGVIAQEDVERAARHFRVAPRVIAHQIENQLEFLVAPY